MVTTQYDMIGFSPPPMTKAVYISNSFLYVIGLSLTHFCTCGTHPEQTTHSNHGYHHIFRTHYKHHRRGLLPRLLFIAEEFRCGYFYHSDGDSPQWGFPYFTICPTNRLTRYVSLSLGISTLYYSIYFPHLRRTIVFNRHNSKHLYYSHCGFLYKDVFRKP